MHHFMSLLVLLLTPPPPGSPARGSSTSWDPSTPVDVEALQTQRGYVVVPRSALCPTVAQAKARECGHSVEFVASGERVTLGTTVTLVGDAPIDGFWRAIRYQKAGTLPSWIRADDVADRPLLAALAAFDRDPQVLAAAKGGDTVVFSRHRGPWFGRDEGARYTLYRDSDAGPLAFRLAVDEAHSFALHHPCLVYGDCMGLSYTCDDTHCDEVSILARRTGRKHTLDAAKDPEGEWPKDWSRRPMPELEVLLWADRFGRFGPLSGGSAGGGSTR